MVCFCMPNRRKQLQMWATGGLSVWMSHALSMGTRPLAPGMRSIKGNVRINGTAAKEGQVVVTDDTVSTGVGGQAIYVMGTNAYLMRENSTVQFGSEGLVSVMRVITGKVLSVFGPGQKRIETSTATVGIRGTGCYIEAAADQVYFCLCYGRADLVPLADTAQARSVLTQHHDSPFYISANTAEPLIQKAPVRNHHDAELTMLEALVGRTPPFAGKGASFY